GLGRGARPASSSWRTRCVTAWPQATAPRPSGAACWTRRGWLPAADYDPDRCSSRAVWSGPPPSCWWRSSAGRGAVRRGRRARRPSWPATPRNCTSGGWTARCIPTSPPRRSWPWTTTSKPTPRSDVNFAVQGAGIRSLRERHQAGFIVGRVGETPVSILVLDRQSLSAFPHDQTRLAGGRHRCREGGYQLVAAVLADNVVVVIG